MSNLPAAALRILDALDTREAFNADRLFRLLFLADWKATLDDRATVTGISWTAEGPSDLVGEVPDEDDEFVRYLQDATGELDLHRIRNRVRDYARKGTALSPQEIEVLDFVSRQAGSKDWRELNRLVFSTRPLLAGPRDKPLDLPRAATEYKATSGYKETLSGV